MNSTFRDIQKGRYLSVGRAVYQMNSVPMQQSPVIKEHSLRLTERKLELNEIDRKN